MAHEFSVEIHNYITNKIDIAEKGKKQADKKGDVKTRRFFEGQLYELLNLRLYLTEKIDLKTQKYY